MSGPEDSTDEYTALLLRAQGGDSQAFANLYAALRPVVSDFVARFGRQPSAYDHEDVIQEVFLRAWGNLSSFRGEASAKTFILAIARNVLRKNLRRRRESSTVAASDVDCLATEDVPASHHPDPDDLNRVIRSAISKLTSVQRQAVRLEECHGLSRAEAARLGNCSPSQFADRLCHARKRLRQLLKDLLPGVLP